MSPKDVREMLEELYSRFRGARYTRAEVNTLIDLLAPVTDSEMLMIQSRALETARFLPTLGDWKGEIRHVLGDRPRGNAIDGPKADPDCPECKGAGASVVHLLSLNDHRYLGEWAIACQRGCPPSVAGLPKSPEAVVAWMRSKRQIHKSSIVVEGEECVAFRSLDELEAWKKAHPESIGRKVML